VLQFNQKVEETQLILLSFGQQTIKYLNTNQFFVLLSQYKS